MHLKSRNHTFHFRLTIPKDLRASFGCCEIKRSLRTGDQAAAKAMASILSLRLRDVFDSARKNTTPLRNFKDVVDDHVKECFCMLEELTLGNTPSHRGKPKAGPEHGCFQGYVQPDVCECGSPEAAHGSSIQPIPTAQSVPLSELISRYNEEQEGGWSVSTRNNYLGIAKVMRQLIGADTPANAINRAVFRDYRNALCRLPKRFSKHPDFERMTSHKVLAMDKPCMTIEPKAVNKYISYASSLFKWARTMGYMEDNPAEGMRLKVEDKETAMFEDDDLARIFACPDYAPENPAQFWVPLLGLYTGARLNEICQLYVKDIAKVEDDEGTFWWISINDEGDDKTVKTKNGRRIVPVHPELVRLGFITYLERLAPEGRVFPELTFSKHRKNYSGQISKSFNRLLSDLKVKPTPAQQAKGMPNKTFHTFRHTAITTLLRANVDRLMMAAVVGHDKKLGVTGNYFHGYESRQLYNDVVTRLDYAVDVFDLVKGHEFAQDCRGSLYPPPFPESRKRQVLTVSP